MKYLVSEKNEQSKIKSIEYKKLELQKYLKSSLFSNTEVEVLSKLRSRNLDLKSNFKNKYTFNGIANLQCSIAGCSEIEDQPHLMKCTKILNELDTNYVLYNLSYDDIFSDDERKQKRVTIILITYRNT